MPNGFSWVVAQWSVWVRHRPPSPPIVLQPRLTFPFAWQASGGLFVPLLHSLPVKEMAYVVRKSGAKRLIVCSSLADKGAELAAETGSVREPCFPPAS